MLSTVQLLALGLVEDSICSSRKSEVSFPRKMQHLCRKLHCSVDKIFHTSYSSRIVMLPRFRLSDTKGTEASADEMEVELFPELLAYQDLCHK
jgi:hypothetical protein